MQIICGLVSYIFEHQWSSGSNFWCFDSLTALVLNLIWRISNFLLIVAKIQSNFAQFVDALHYQSLFKYHLESFNFIIWYIMIAFYDELFTLFYGYCHNRPPPLYLNKKQGYNIAPINIAESFRLPLFQEHKNCLQNMTGSRLGITTSILNLTRLKCIIFPLKPWK